MKYSFDTNDILHSGNKVFAIDLDYTLIKHTKSLPPYIPKREIKERPNRELVNYLWKLRKDRPDVVLCVLSSRWWGEYNTVNNWIKKWNIPIDYIELGRFKADVLIDDRNVNGTLKGWQKQVDKLLK